MVQEVLAFLVCTGIENMLWGNHSLQSVYLALALTGLNYVRFRYAALNLILSVIIYFTAIYTVSYACIRFSHPIMPR